MAGLGRKKKVPNKRTSVKRKRGLEEEFEGEDHDEFFEDDDHPQKAGDEEVNDEELKETPEEARRRLGVRRYG
jgi:hypothetical protein